MQEKKNKIGDIIKSVDTYLKKLDSIREEIVKISRDVIRYSGWSITEAHKGDIDSALNYLHECENKAKELIKLSLNAPELTYSGLVYNALSEFVEAKVFLNIITNKEIPTNDDLNVPPVPYLQGLGDVVGELKRYALESVRKGNFDNAWKSLEIMETIYLEMRSLDYSDSILPGVRHKIDVARNLVDETKSLIVDLQSRENLKVMLNNLMERKYNE
ncbi:putative RNA-binding protein of the translin family [Caldisphaera lagunensis DSM 15908]|uniref:Putative RNA-binding protein of the translin family n=1 Tax=Caldisphaera lagunensis (strain DSM 15908 / JCM 11604 / ANMR 0165 / IC-154) TaxID=1056495 RepID=L0ACM7_CALLD|nr:RNA-binding protein [Caldisphaera lagunensis]AFZ71179.1 putative RNA-binding protein of the translin family [Caldisphaera lagunensis DSM 15908]